MAIEDFYVDSVTFTLDAEDKYGEPTMSATSTPKARVVMGESVVTTAAGAELRVKGLVWMANTTVTTRYTLTYDGTEYAIAFIDKPKAQGTGIHHLRLGLA